MNDDKRNHVYRLHFLSGTTTEDRPTNYLYYTIRFFSNSLVRVFLYSELLTWKPFLVLVLSHATFEYKMYYSVTVEHKPTEECL